MNDLKYGESLGGYRHQIGVLLFFVLVAVTFFLYSGASVINSKQTVSAAQLGPFGGWVNNPAWDPPSWSITGQSTRFGAGDLDGDGDYDLIALSGGSSGGGAQATGLRNIGTAAFPIWQVDNSLIAGITVSPVPSDELSRGIVLADIDNDNLLDLLAGISGDVVLWKNVGTASDPSWSFRGAVITGLNHTSVTAGDLDGDGDKDLLVMDTTSTVDGSNTMLGYENTGTPASPVWNRNSAWDISGAIHVGPSLGDIDADGDLDLVIGQNNSVGTAHIVSYRNRGTEQNLIWEPGDFDVAYTLNSEGEPSPVFVDVDADGILDLVVGYGGPRDPRTYSNLTTGGLVVVVDADGDGFLDIADACRTTPGIYQGCQFGDKITVVFYTICQGKDKTACEGIDTTKQPLAGALVKVFDRARLAGLSLAGLNSGSCSGETVVLGNGNINKGDLYPDIFECAPSTALAAPLGCTTDADGICIAGEPAAGDYLVIVKFTDIGLNKAVYAGKNKSPSDFVDGLASKTLQFSKVYGSDGSVEIRGR